MHERTPKTTPSAYRHIRTVCAVIAILCASALLLWHRPAPQYVLEKGTPHMQETSALFARDIREFGGREAYARLSIAVRGLGIDDQHGYAHAFGHQLYSIEGEHGIVACDANFGLGCFHQFLGDAVADMGTSSVQRLYDECAGVTGSKDLCEHGLGHGVLSGVGYEEKDLQAALDLCDSVTKIVSYSGCEGGAFMEYNIRTIASAEGTMSGRVPENGDLYAPCDSIKVPNRKICTFWLPEWWYFIVMEGNSPTASKQTIYAHMGELCRNSAYPQACFEGIGYITPTAFGFEVLPARAACDAVGEPGGGNAYCRGMAGLIFHISPGTRDTAAGLCAGLTGNAGEVCMQYASQERNFSFSSPEVL